MSFAPNEEDDPCPCLSSNAGSSTGAGCRSSNLIVKSVKSAWKKAKFRRWRRTMDLEKARKDHLDDANKSLEKMEEAKEDALFYPAEQGAESLPVAQQNPSSNCVCIRYTADQQQSSSHQAFMNSFLLPPSSSSTSIALLPKENNPRANFQVDYVNYLIPGLKEIFSCPFYWGKMDRYEAEALLANKPEGSFLLRDSAQENYVFSVSFRRYSRSLHARIEETRHKFSFDCHDPGVHASRSIRGLLDYYKDPLSCMFFEPMLLFPILRKKPFSLQELARTVICDSTTYDGVSELPIPKTLKEFLREYHYKHKVESRALELNPSILCTIPKND